MAQFEATDVITGLSGTDAPLKAWVTPMVIVSQARSAESANGSAPSDFVTSSIPYSS